jgi:hypothetical protein
MPLTYTDCLNAIRHHRREAAWCEERSNESLYSSAYLCRQYEELAAGHRETAREYAQCAWDMRAAMRPSRRMAA